MVAEMLCVNLIHDLELRQISQKNRTFDHFAEVAAGCFTDRLHVLEYLFGLGCNMPRNQQSRFGDEWNLSG